MKNSFYKFGFLTILSFIVSCSGKNPTSTPSSTNTSQPSNTSIVGATQTAINPDPGTKLIDQLIDSTLPIILGGGIAITTQWLIAREQQTSNNKEKLQANRLEKYTKIWTWLCTYDRPDSNYESVHNNWISSNEKYRELRSLVLGASPFLSAKMHSCLKDFLDFWRNDLSDWRNSNSRPISEIEDRIYSKVDEYNNYVEKVLNVSQSEIMTLFDLRK